MPPLSWESQVSQGDLRPKDLLGCFYQSAARVLVVASAAPF